MIGPFQFQRQCEAAGVDIETFHKNYITEYFGDYEPDSFNYFEKRTDLSPYHEWQPDPSMRMMNEMSRIMWDIIEKRKETLIFMNFRLTPNYIHLVWKTLKK